MFILMLIIAILTLVALIIFTMIEMNSVETASKKSIKMVQKRYGDLEEE